MKGLLYKAVKPIKVMMKLQLMFCDQRGKHRFNKVIQHLNFSLIEYRIIFGIKGLEPTGGKGAFLLGAKKLKCHNNGWYSSRQAFDSGLRYNIRRSERLSKRQR